MYKIILGIVGIIILFITGILIYRHKERIKYIRDNIKGYINMRVMVYSIVGIGVIVLGIVGIIEVVGR